jgi:hypothetical protein
MKIPVLLIAGADLVVAGILIHPWAAEAASAWGAEPEDSPLYAAAVQKAFAQFTLLDRTSRPTRTVSARLVPTSGTIVVEGERWYRLASDPVVTASAGIAAYGGQKPNGTTYDSSPTCVATSCQIACPPTSHGGPTCAPNASCTPSITCASPTCGPSPTCSQPTCVDWPTCGGVPTCSTTCMGTCDILSCPAPSLSSVTVSNNPAVPGEYVVALRFNASGTVKYTVQYSTNLNAPEWSDIFSKLGDNSTTMVVHSNAAPRAFYRVVMQNP